MMGHGVVWEPSTKKEVEYYDKLFQAVDRDNSGTLDGKETIQFLGHSSGLTKAQLKVCHGHVHFSNTASAEFIDTLHCL